MSEPNEEQLTVEFDAIGQRFTNIVSYSLQSSWTTPTDGWRFTVFDDENPGLLRRMFRPLQLVTLYINDKPQLFGRIDTTQGVGSGSMLEVMGRDYMADIQDASVDPKIQLKQDMTLDAALFKIFEPWGIDTLLGNFNPVRNLLTGKNTYSGQPARDFKTAKLSDFDSKDHQGVWELAMELVARHGYTIQQGVSRNSLAVVAPEYGQETTFTLRRPGNMPTSNGRSGNIKTASARRDYSRVPTVTIARGRAAAKTASNPGISFEASTFAENSPSAIGKVREVQQTTSGLVRDARWKPGDATTFANKYPLYRPMFYVDKESRTPEQLERGVRHELAERLRETLVYECTLHGHEDPATGTAYAVDTMAMVIDPVEDVEEPLWIESREFVNDGNGPETRLRLVRPESYVL